MALIETFLKLMADKRAERLVLDAGAVPYLLKGGESVALSMPALRAEILERIAGEITGEEPAISSRREGSFRSADGGSFAYAILPCESGLRLEIHAAGVAKPPPEEADALARAVAHFTSHGGEPAVPAPIPPPVGGLALLARIDQAATGEVSDIFFSSGRPLRVRRHGQLVAVDGEPPREEEILELIPDAAARQRFEHSGSVDFALRLTLSGGSRRFRLNVFRHRDGVAAALRPIRTKVPPLAELGLPESLLELIAHPHGLVLVTGTSGSGKSTTLAALVDHLNRTAAKHVITIEDPVEYAHTGHQCLIHQREVGADVESFSAGLHAALRENPDVILLGELRDLATISAALTAAETGHLVLATLHSGTTSSAVNRIVDVFPGHQQPHIRVQLAASLRAVISQRLVPARGGRRIPVIEKLVVTPAVASGIRDAQDHNIRTAMLTGAEQGMITLERSLAGLVRKGLIDRDAAQRHAMDRQALDHLLG